MDEDRKPAEPETLRHKVSGALASKIIGGFDGALRKSRRQRAWKHDREQCPWHTKKGRR